MSYYDPYYGISPEPSYPLYQPLYNPQPVAPPPAPVVSIPESTSPLQTQLFPSLTIGSKPIPNYVYIIVCIACVILILCVIASVVSASANIGPPTTKPPTTTKSPTLNTTKPVTKSTSQTSTQSKDSIISVPVVITTTTTPPPTTTIPPLSIYCSDMNLTTLMNKYPYWTSGDRVTMLNILSNVTNNKDTSITNDNIYKKLKLECEL